MRGIAVWVNWKYTTANKERQVLKITATCGHQIPEIYKACYWFNGELSFGVLCLECRKLYKGMLFETLEDYEKAKIKPAIKSAPQQEGEN